MPSEPAMLGTDTLAMVMSSTAMKFAPARTMATSHNNAPLRGASPASAFSIAVIAFSRSNYRSTLVGARIDGRFHRQAHLQRPLRELGCIELDAHRHALDHLDPVSRRVLRRNRGERGTGAARQTDDAAVISYRPAVQVRLHFHGLADAHALELALLEIGVDVHIAH